MADVPVADDIDVPRVSGFDMVVCYRCRKDAACDRRSRFSPIRYLINYTHYGSYATLPTSTGRVLTRTLDEGASRRRPLPAARRAALAAMTSWVDAFSDAESSSCSRPADPEDPGG